MRQPGTFTGSNRMLATGSFIPWWKRPRRTWSLLLVWFLYAASIGFGQAADQTRLRHDAMAEYSIGHFGKAEMLLTPALESARQRGDSDEIASILKALGDVYFNEERFPEAEQAYQQALLIFKESPAKRIEVAGTLRDLGALHSSQRRNREAMAVLKEALKIIGTNATAQQDLASEVLNSMGIVYFRQGKLGKADAMTTKAIQMYSSLVEPDARRVSALNNNLAMIYQKQRKYVKAEENYRRSLEIGERWLGELHPDVALTRANLGLLYTEMRRFEPAEEQLLLSLAITEQTDPIVKGRVVRTLQLLGSAYFRDGKITEAESVLARAVQIARHAPDLATEIPVVLEAYSGILKRQGKLQEARTIQAEARKARAEFALTVPAH